MKIKIILPVLLIIATVNFCKAQSSGKHRTTVFVEFFGNGLGVSGNFDMRLKLNINDGLGVRAGAGIFETYITLPLGLNYIAGKKKSGFESGIGITPIYNFDPGSERNIGLFEVGHKPSKFAVIGVLNAGYRFQGTKGFTFRASPDVYYYNKNLYIRAGLSIGLVLN